jgi:hypothetical protein
MVSVKPSGSLEYDPKSGRTFKSPSEIQIDPLPNFTERQLSVVIDNKTLERYCAITPERRWSNDKF